MFEMICRVFKIAGNSRRKIVAGIVCNILKSFFNGFMMFGVFWILLHLDGLSPAIIGQAFGVILGSVLGRFFFQWMYDRMAAGNKAALMTTLPDCSTEAPMEARITIS